MVEQLTGHRPTRRCRLVRFGDIDEGLIGAPGDRVCQLMPHGGVRVVQRIAERLRELGARPWSASGDEAARRVYPEAATPLEADMLAALGRAASPAAIDLLLDQPRRWREAVAHWAGLGDGDRAAALAEVRKRSAVLDHLLSPPTVALVGRANVGKSTLSNLVLDRSASIVADLPGTTRDWVAGLAELAITMPDSDAHALPGTRPPPETGRLPETGPLPEAEAGSEPFPGAGSLPGAGAGVAVWWVDTPGLRAGADVIEQRAIDLARAATAGAHVLIAVAEPDTDWPDAAALSRKPDLWVLNKADLLGGRLADVADPAAGHAPQQPLHLSALRGEGLAALDAAIGAALGFDHVNPAAAWAFSSALREAIAAGDLEALRRQLADERAVT
jgi:hypothetical protein